MRHSLLLAFALAGFGAFGVGCDAADPLADTAGAARVPFAPEVHTIAEGTTYAVPKSAFTGSQSDRVDLVITASDVKTEGGITQGTLSGSYASSRGLSPVGPVRQAVKGTFKQIGGALAVEFTIGDAGHAVSFDGHADAHALHVRTADDQFFAADQTYTLRPVAQKTPFAPDAPTLSEDAVYALPKSAFTGADGRSLRFELAPYELKTERGVTTGRVSGVYEGARPSAIGTPSGDVTSPVVGAVREEFKGTLKQSGADIAIEVYFEALGRAVTFEGTVGAGSLQLSTRDGAYFAAGHTYTLRVD